MKLKYSYSISVLMKNLKKYEIYNFVQTFSGKCEFPNLFSQKIEIFLEKLNATKM